MSSWRLHSPLGPGRPWIGRNRRRAIGIQTRVNSTGDTTAVRELASGFRKRTLVTARLMSRMGLKMARKNLGLSETMSNIDEDEAVAAARALLDELDGLKGFAVKVGQMISYLDGSLPPKAQRILARLQFASRPMETERIAEVIADELGAPPDQVFDHFDPTPMAAASIGQVHRARAGGRDLAVKIQYPGIDELLRKDLQTISRMSRLALLASPVDGKGMARELTERMLDECDYLAEAENQDWFRDALSGIKGVSIPPVVREFTTRRVFTSGFVDRMNFYEFCETAPQEAKNRAARLIYQACFTAIFQRHAYNADPHPGNYLFDESGDVTLLDFGCVKRFQPRMIAAWKRLARSILDGDRARFADAFVAAGFVGRKRRFDYAHQLDAMRELYRPMLSDEPFTFTHEWVAEIHDHLMFKNKNKFKLTMPPDWLFVNRLQFGMFSVLAHMGATARWGDLFRAALA